MTVTHIRPGHLRSEGIGSDWVLVLGGTTPLGQRRAERAIAALGPRALDLVWFDGSGQQPSNSADEQLSPVGTNLVVIHFSQTLDKTLSARLRAGGTLPQHRWSRKLWRGILRPLGGALLPRASWTAIKPDVRKLRGATAPRLIVCCDDTAITSAWMASRMWPNSNVITAIEDETQ